MKRLSVLLLLLISSASFAVESAPRQVDLGKLYQSYVKAGRSTMDLPEFEKRISFSGVAMEVTQGFKRGAGSANGGTLLKAGVASSDDVLARLVARDATNEAKMEVLKSRAAFKATCTVAFASGANFIPLQDCVLH